MLLPYLMVGLVTLQGVVSQDPAPLVYRLPTTVTPQQYMIQLEPDMDSMVIKGSIRIEVMTTSDETQTLNSITMHVGTDVTVNETSAAILEMTGIIQEIGAVIYDDVSSLLVLELPEGETLDYNQLYVISLHFQSVLNTAPKGLFTGAFNSTSNYIASNFRPTHARDVFPCFDEPHLKVPVTLQVWRPASYCAISTASLAYSSDVTADNKVLDTFMKTEPISIHSLGLFISQQPTVESMNVSVVVPPSIPPSVTYLDTIISKILDLMTSPFPHSPLYLIVLPDRTQISFSSYGFVFTSPEVYLGEVASSLQQTRLQLQLTEEFLRQFLEFSKTPQWWSDLWLSESIGAFLSLPLQQNEPWLQDWLDIVVRSEALGSYTRMTGPVITDQDLSRWDIENLITNQTLKQKGISILSMFEKTMPEGLVEKTLLEFIKLPQSVVNTTDLLNLMVENIKANTTYDVSPAIPLLPNWLTHPGSPLVWFTIDSNSTFTLVQGTPCSPDSPAPALRSISVALAEGSAPVWNNTLQGLWLLNASSQFTVSDISESSIINIETAPYRVNYPDSQWSALLQALSSDWAPPSVASTLRDDSVALSLDGCLNFSISLSLLNSSRQCDLEWWPVVKAAEAFTASIGDDSYGISAFGKYFASLFPEYLLDQLDLRNSANHSELSVARELLTPWLCRFNISTCQEAVVELGEALWAGNTSGIAGSDLENVACYGARYTPGALEPLLDAYQNADADSAWLRRHFTIALSCLTEQDSVIKLLDIITDSNSTSNSSSLDQDDARQILTGLASCLENSPSVLNTIVNQCAIIQEKLGVYTLSSVIKNLAKNRVDLSQLSSLQDNTQLDPYVTQSVVEAMAISNRSQSWYSSHINDLYLYLPPGDIPSTTSTTTSTTTTTSTSTTTTTTEPTPTTPTPTPKPTPGSAPALSDCRVFTIALMALLIILQ